MSAEMNVWDVINFAFWGIAFLVLLLQLFKSVQLVPTQRARIVERLGKYHATLRAGFHILLPFLDRVAFNKKNILRRDGYACQYCNRRGERLTVDHVVPRSRGGETSWTNVVAACLRCNLRKGNRLPTEAGMRLLRDPFHPKFLFSTHLLRHPHAHSLLDSWRKYLVVTV